MTPIPKGRKRKMYDIPAEICTRFENAVAKNQIAERQSGQRPTSERQVVTALMERFVAEVNGET